MERSSIQTIDNQFSDADITFMQLAIEQAKLAMLQDEVPVGAVIVIDNQVVAARHNEVETTKNATAHAESLAINEAISKVGEKIIPEATLYVTLEPCSMCAGILVLSRVKRLVYAAKDPKSGAVDSLYSITNDDRLNHRLIVQSGLLEEESSQILKEFFKNKREEKKREN